MVRMETPSQSVRSLKSRRHPLEDSKEQVRILSKSGPNFAESLKSVGLHPLRPTALDILQINVGKMCNQTCQHCHVDAGPGRREIMDRETMEQCFKALELGGFSTVDLTGGAPELNPHFRWFVEEVRKRNVDVMVRCNLTIILSNVKFNDLPEFFAKHRIHVVSSLPYYSEKNVDFQRGKGVFAKSIRALQMLNSVGYGKEASGLKLDLVYNPVGPFLPPSQENLKKDYERRLKDDFGIVFNDLYTITNMPISRFLDSLIQSGQYEDYLSTLVNAFNGDAARGVMCRNTLSVGWDGKLYDCDFNQMLELEIGHISDFSVNRVANRSIVVNAHRYGCTAGSGSSCGGALT